MAVVVDNYNDATYTLVLNSNDKISGTNNQATFQVNWVDFLPVEYERYKMVFTFQTTGGYYSDGSYPPASLALRSSSTTTVVNAPGVNNFIITPAPAIGRYISCVGITAGTTVTAFSGTNPYTMNISQPTYAGLPAASTVGFYLPTDVSAINFSAARISFATGSRSYSFDTSTKASSTNLGVVQRDIQTTQSKSNTLSAFYCQNPPRTIARPESNIITISIYNNCNFFGSNSNLLTDTTSSGTLATDMTPWTMFVEFIPVKDSRKQKYNEM